MSLSSPFPWAYQEQASLGIQGILPLHLGPSPSCTSCLVPSLIGSGPCGFDFWSVPVVSNSVVCQSRSLSLSPIWFLCGSFPLSVSFFLSVTLFTSGFPYLCLVPISVCRPVSRGSCLSWEVRSVFRCVPRLPNTLSPQVISMTPLGRLYLLRVLGAPAVFLLGLLLALPLGAQVRQQENGGAGVA